jgi:TPR repeat protein
MIFNKWINFSIYVLVISNFCCPNHLFSQNSTQQKWVQNNIKYSTQLREAKKSGNRDSLVTAYLNLGNLNLKQNGASRDYEKSKNFFEKALSKIDSSDIKTRALCFEKLGDCARYSASTLAAIKNYDKAFEYYFTLKNFDKLGLMLHRKGDCILDQKNYILAKKKLPQSNRILPKKQQRK